MSAVMPGLMALVMFSLGRSFPTNIRGVGNWASGALIVSAAAILLALRGTIPDWLSIIGGNGGMILSTGLWLIGSQRFYGRPPAWRFVLLMLLVGMTSVAWMTWIHPSAPGRALCINAILALIYGRQTLLLLSHGRHDASAMFIGVMFLIQTAVTSVRVVTSIGSGFSATGLYGRDSIQTVYLATGAFMSLTATVGFMLVAMNRLRLQLEQQSLADPLTGLLNRRAFLNAHREEREKMMRTGGLLSLLLIDLDHFKVINDTHGHVKGDEILVDFSERAAGMLTWQHHLSRWGGEEFAALVPGLRPEDVFDLADALRARIARNENPALPAYTCSIGIACTASGDATIERLVKDADEALYRAKRNGRNSVELNDQAVLV
ncbi:GGDEF domain-containing protein [Paraburkholderia sp. DHOC27]|uniref:GGDEF domain-containing protein n=1 Tax=Paraburkholderia sp. DHOC27 TaxID=2303330 RepID=UPI00216B23E8|nr:GGDEF domain-containing protein [Paraburkholderia sp. DHOC27]